MSLRRLFGARGYEVRKRWRQVKAAGQQTRLTATLRGAGYSLDGRKINFC